ncbi:MAG: cobalt ECF transporter T component CbiQ [Thermodesulfovibrionales bacterium]|nr:cobalt ECF transporter T component CbiQ [Thermodesulfovibrionales bacterium]
MEIFAEHLRKDHLLSKVDARIKLLSALSLLGMVLSYKGFAFPVIITAICVFLCVRMKIPLKIFILRFSEPLFIAAVIVLLKFFISGRDGLIDGILIACRIIGAVSVVAVLGFSTPFTEIMSALSWMRIPKGFIEILMLAYRYVFVLLEDAMVIYNAQKNRLGYCSIKRGLSSFGTLAGSLVLKAFEHSHNITTAMIQRGYDGNIPAMKHKPFKLHDIAFSVILITIIGALWTI